MTFIKKLTAKLQQYLMNEQEDYPLKQAIPQKERFNNWIQQEKRIRKKVTKLYKEQTSRIPNPFEEEEERLSALNKQLLFAKRLIPREHDSRDFLSDYEQEEIKEEDLINTDFPKLFSDKKLREVPEKKIPEKIFLTDIFFKKIWGRTFPNAFLT